MNVFVPKQLYIQNSKRLLKVKYFHYAEVLIQFVFWTEACS